MKITLGKRKEIDITLNDRECFMAFDTTSIDHFQDTTKMQLGKALEELQKEKISVMYKLIISMVKDKKTNKILGEKFFKNFNDFEVVNALREPLMELLMSELPEAKTEDEKK